MLRAAVDEVVVLVTVGSEEEGAAIARSVVSSKLAACVNMLPAIRSFYWWEDNVQDDAELLLIIKSRQPALAALFEAIQAIHSYDVPEFITLPVEEGSQRYLDWVRKSVPLVEGT
ncbi:MAG: divalent-cation tolerance protein CutA [Myxococcota bacterium]|nr:divalent-cation tolerance protein CutA [Myxococcota bacterium]